jgi:mono/diheme cytochrome c family protein
MACSVVVLICPPGRAQDRQPEVLEASYRATVLPFLKAHCLECHGRDDPEAKLDLSDYTSAATVASSHQIWETVLHRVVAREMPPGDSENQPTAQQRKGVVAWIHAAREHEARRNAGDPGLVLARRLSNAEYNASIRDLTGFDIRPTRTFPVDPANVAGFDNSGESLAMSPALLRKYLQATREVVEHMVLKPEGIAFAPHSAVTDTDRDRYCVKRIVRFYERQPTDLADYFLAAWQYRFRKLLGRGSETVEAVATRNAVSKKYLKTVLDLLTDEDPRISVGPIQRLRELWPGAPNGNVEADAVRLKCERMRDYVKALRVKLRPRVEDLKLEGNHVGSQPFVLWKNRQYVANRRTYGRTLLQVGETPLPKGAVVDPELAVPMDETERKRYEAAFDRFCSIFPDAFYVSERGRDYVQESKKQMGEKGRLLSAGFHSMMGYFRDDGPLYDMVLTMAQQQELDRLWRELDFVTGAPMRQYSGFLWFERTDSRYMREPQFDFARPENQESLRQPMIRQLSKVYLEKARRIGGTDTQISAMEHYFREINEQIRWVEAARRKAESSHLQGVLDLADRAWRRSLSKNEKSGLADYYQELRQQDDLSHEEAIQDLVVSVLMSPHFCFRVDMAGSGNGRTPLTDDELASRLSYFLWSSIPDKELRNLAGSGRLRAPEVLSAQVKRMLLDDRVQGLATEFTGNWLGFRRFQEHNSVDRKRFSVFTDELRQAMFEEPTHFVVDVLQKDRSVLDLLDAKHTFMNATLASHYGMSAKRFKMAVDGEGPRSGVESATGPWLRIEDADMFGRGGLLPMAVFLTKNAPGLRTSPVKRGYWVARRLLGERIPPPPPNVPELPQDESELGDLTLREALARHRDNKSCAGCHDRFDTIGLAFEGYGPVGERRTRDLGGRPVSTQAVFPGGHSGSGLNGLQAYLREHRQEEYLDNLCRKLLSFALGRSLVLSDDLLVREMRTNLAENGYRIGSLVESVVSSSQFLNRRSGKKLEGK